MTSTTTAPSSPARPIMGAHTLYLDFINLFLMLLRLFGDRQLSVPTSAIQGVPGLTAGAFKLKVVPAAVVIRARAK